MNDLVIETNDLTKCYGEQVCVAQLCLHVPKGKIYALLGEKWSWEDDNYENVVEFGKTHIRIY